MNPNLIDARDLTVLRKNVVEGKLLRRANLVNLSQS